MRRRPPAVMTRLWGLLLVVGLLAGGLNMALAGPPQQEGDAAALLIAARTDLESLANAVIEDGLRPVGWTQTLDVLSSNFAIDLRLDLEILAGNMLGAEVRPPGWFGAVAGSPWSLGRDARHDLELLADRLLGPDNRPDIWIGGAPLLRCERALQALVMWLQGNNSVYQLSGFDPDAAYCSLIAEETNLFTEVLIPGDPPDGDLRADLDTLLDEMLPTGEALPGWRGEADLASVRQDLDLLFAASGEFAPVLQAEWFGPGVGAEWVLARGIRHDLELLADAVLAFSQRPPQWTHPVSATLVRCPRATQNLIGLLRAEANFVFSSADPAQSDFCAAVAVEASAFVEQYESSPATTPGGSGGGLIVTTDTEPDAEAQPGAEASGGTVVMTGAGIMGEARNPNIFLDHSARLEVGLMPRGTSFLALARSSAPDSRMMYVQGDRFQVWLAWPYTSITEAEYNALPLADEVEQQLPALLCMAWFCTDLVANGDPLNDGSVAGFTPASAGGGLAQPGDNLQRADYSQARFYIEVDEPVAGWAEFRADICGVPGNPATCEPVLRLWEFGQVVPPVRMSGAYPVWRLGYNFHGTARLESSNYYVEQLWITHPYDR